MRASDRDRSRATTSTSTCVAPHAEFARAAVVNIKKLQAGWLGACCRKLEEMAAGLRHVVREAARRTELGEQRRLDRPTGAGGGGGVRPGRHRLHNDEGSKASAAAWHDRRRAWGLV